MIKVLPKLDPDIFLEIVGDGPYRVALLDLARKMGVQTKVRFYASLQRKELLQKYADADLFVLLSNHECYGICVAEALASRTPCIVANTSSLREWVDGKNCFGVRYPIEIEDLRKSIVAVIGKQISQVPIYEWNHAVKELTKIYERVNEGDTSL